MTRLKVFNSQTNITYYLNNVDVSCAKLHSYIGETKNNDIIIHKPSPYLEYSLEKSGQPITYKTNVEELNGLYTNHPSSDFSGYFPNNTGIIISIMLTDLGDGAPGDIPNYTPYRIDCSNITIDETTYWCPPVIKRNIAYFAPPTIQSTRVSSFSYIHNMLLSSLFIPIDQPYKFMIYDNRKLSNLLPDKLFAMYPGDSASEQCLPNYYCPSGGIGACINNQLNGKQGSCSQDCSSLWTPESWLPLFTSSCSNYNKFINSINKLQKNSNSINYNELVIKSWNYNSDSSMSDRGIKQQNDGRWVAQDTSLNPKSPWGWNDVSSLSSNENIPLLAFGVTVPDRTTISDISKMLINNMYIDLSNNLEPSFNKYRSEHEIPLMPYYIGLDVSCLTRRDCSNPFFDLADILSIPTPAPTPIHTAYSVKDNDTCYTIAHHICGPITTCSSFNNCPAICDGLYVCPNLQAGQQIYIDCGEKNTYCS